MRQRMSQQQGYQKFPALPQALADIGNAINKSDLDSSLQHLVDIRASQLNSCAFCLDMHHREAREHGESQQRLDVISAWREVPWFSAQEQAALAWTEALTDLSRGHPQDALYNSLREHFSEEQIMALTAAIIKINGWNRFVAALHLIPALKA